MADDPAVVHVGDPLAELEDAVVVGHHDDGPVGPDGRLAEQLHDGQARLVVQRGRRLVADQQPRLVDQGPGDGDPLHLAARELAGQARRASSPCPASPGPRRRGGRPARATSRRSPAGSPRSRRRSRPAGGCTAGRRTRCSAPGSSSAPGRVIAVSDWPKMATSPASLSRIPATTDRSVVLPQPDGPDDQRELAGVDVPVHAPQRLDCAARRCRNPCVSPRIRTATAGPTRIVLGDDRDRPPSPLLMQRPSSQSSIESGTGIGPRRTGPIGIGLNGRRSPAPAGSPAGR